MTQIIIEPSRISPIIGISGWAIGREWISAAAESLLGSDIQMRACAISELYRAGLSVNDDGTANTSDRFIAARTPLLSGLRSYIGAELSHLNLPTSTAPVLIGWSSGAMLALDYASQYPVKGLILLGCAPRFCACANYTSGIPPAELELLEQTLRINPREGFRRFFLHMYGSKAVDLEPIIEQALSLGADALLGVLDYLGGFDVREDLASIESPALILHGARDRVIPVKLALELKAALRNAEILVFADAGHDLLRSCDVERELITKKIQAMFFSS